MDWQAIETAPQDGTTIIGLGYSRPAAKRNGDLPDVRIIRAWSIAGDFGGWSALNDHSWFTVAFYPDQWIPLPRIWEAAVADNAGELMQMRLDDERESLWDRLRREEREEIAKLGKERA